MLLLGLGTCFSLFLILSLVNLFGNLGLLKELARVWCGGLDPKITTQFLSITERSTSVSPFIITIKVL